MVVHIVMFRLKDEHKEQHIREAEAKLTGLLGSVPTLRSMEVGVNFSPEGRAMDMSLIATFDDIEGLEMYATHPAHLEVVAFIKEVAVESKVVDYYK